MVDSVFPVLLNYLLTFPNGDYPVKILVFWLVGKKRRAVPSFPQGKTRLEPSVAAPWMGICPAHDPSLCHLPAVVGSGIVCTL